MIAKPSALSKTAGQPLANKSITNVLVTALIPLFAKPVESTKASKVKPPYKPEVTGVAWLILIWYKRLISVVPRAAASNTKKILSLTAAISPIFQSCNLIWFAPVPIMPSFK